MENRSSLYHFTAACQRGAATDLVEYLAANAARLGIVMRKRPTTPSHFAHVRALTAATGP